MRREDEVNRGLSKLAEYKGLDQYADMARQSGTNLATALERYVAAEQVLERNPIQGLLWLAQTYGVQPQALMQAMGGQRVAGPAGFPAGHAAGRPVRDSAGCPAAS